MRADAARSEALGGVVDEDLFNEVLPNGGDKVWDAELALEDLFVELGSVRVFKWKEAANQSKKNDAATPGINLCPNILLASNHLRSCVTRRPACRLESIPLRKSIRKSKIHNLNIIIMIQQQIFRLQISVHNIESMHIFHS